MAIKLNGDDPLLGKLKIKHKFSFFWNEGDKRSLMEPITKLGLTDRQQFMVGYLISCSKDTWSDPMPSIFSVIKEKHGLVEGTLRRILNELTEIGVLKREQVYIEDKLMPRGTAYIFNTLKAIENAYITRLNSKLASSANRGNSADKRNSSLALSEKFGITADDEDIRNYMPTAVIFPSGVIPPEYLALANERATNRNFESRNFKRHVGPSAVDHFAIEVRAHTQVNTKSAFSTLIAYFVIAVAYNTKMLKTGRYTKAFEQTMFPANMVDILHVRGLRDSGQARKRIYEQTLQLRESIYNFIQLAGEQDGAILDHPLFGDLFGTKDFNYIQSVETNSTIAPIQREGKTIVTPSKFFITFHELIMERLSKSDFFFTVPDEVAFGDPLIFSFYLTLRNIKATIESLLLSEIMGIMYYEGSVSKFQKSIKAALSPYDISETNAEFDYDLCGYLLRFGKNADGEQTLYIVCDSERMITSSGAVYRPELADKNAPTIANPLKYLASPDEQIGETILVEFNTTYQLPETRRSNFYKKYNVLGQLYVVSKYSTDSEIDAFRDAVASMPRMTKKYAQLTVDAILDSTRLVTCEDLVIIPEVFDDIMAYVWSHEGKSIKTHELIDILKYFRAKKMTAVLNGDFSVVSDALQVALLKGNLSN